MAALGVPVLVTVFVVTPAVALLTVTVFVRVASVSVAIGEFVSPSSSMGTALARLPNSSPHDVGLAEHRGLPVVGLCWGRVPRVSTRKVDTAAMLFGGCGDRIALPDQGQPLPLLHMLKLTKEAENSAGAKLKAAQNG